MRNVSILALVFGAAWMVYAVRGILGRRIRTYPRGSRGATYEGRDAVLQGVVELLFGLAFFGIGLVLFLAS